MVENQLLDHVKSQLQGGATREVVKTALMGAGWPEADVEDTIKNVEASVLPKTAPAIVVSDLVANSSLEVLPVEVKNAKAENAEPPKNFPEAGLPAQAGAKKFNKTSVIKIALGVVALLFAGTAVFLFFQNSGLKEKMAASSGVTDAANAKVAALNSQVGDLNKQIADLNSKLATLTGDNQKLIAELSFFVVPAGSPSEEAAFTLKGKVEVGGKVLYVVTADDGLKVTVKNSKDEKVDAALKPLVGQTAEISGTHAAGSRDATVTAVNGASVQ